MPFTLSQLRSQDIRDIGNFYQQDNIKKISGDANDKRDFSYVAFRGKLFSTDAEEDNNLFKTSTQVSTVTDVRNTENCIDEPKTKKKHKKNRHQKVIDFTGSKCSFQDSESSCATEGSNKSKKKKHKKSFDTEYAFNKNYCHLENDRLSVSKGNSTPKSAKTKKRWGEDGSSENIRYSHDAGDVTSWEYFELPNTTDVGNRKRKYSSENDLETRDKVLSKISKSFHSEISMENSAVTVENAEKLDDFVMPKSLKLEEDISTDTDLLDSYLYFSYKSKQPKKKKKEEIGSVPMPIIIKTENDLDEEELSFRNAMQDNSVYVDQLVSGAPKKHKKKHKDYLRDKDDKDTWSYDETKSEKKKDKNELHEDELDGKKHPEDAYPERITSDKNEKRKHRNTLQSEEDCDKHKKKHKDYLHDKDDNDTCSYDETKSEKKKDTNQIHEDELDGKKHPGNVERIISDKNERRKQRNVLPNEEDCDKHKKQHKDYLHDKDDNDTCSYDETKSEKKKDKNRIHEDKANGKKHLEDGYRERIINDKNERRKHRKALQNEEDCDKHKKKHKDYLHDKDDNDTCSYDETKSEKKKDKNEIHEDELDGKKHKRQEHRNTLQSEEDCDKHKKKHKDHVDDEENNDMCSHNETESIRKKHKKKHKDHVDDEENNDMCSHNETESIRKKHKKKHKDLVDDENINHMCSHNETESIRKKHKKKHKDHVDDEENNDMCSHNETKSIRKKHKKKHKDHVDDENINDMCSHNETESIRKKHKKKRKDEMPEYNKRDEKKYENASRSIEDDDKEPQLNNIKNSTLIHGVKRKHSSKHRSNDVIIEENDESYVAFENVLLDNEVINSVCDRKSKKHKKRSKDIPEEEDNFQVQQEDFRHDEECSEQEFKRKNKKKSKVWKEEREVESYVNLEPLIDIDVKDVEDHSSSDGPDDRFYMKKKDNRHGLCNNEVVVENDVISDSLSGKGDIVNTFKEKLSPLLDQISAESLEWLDDRTRNKTLHLQINLTFTQTESNVQDCIEVDCCNNSKLLSGCDTLPSNITCDGCLKDCTKINLEENEKLPECEQSKVNMTTSITQEDDVQDCPKVNSDINKKLSDSQLMLSSNIISDDLKDYTKINCDRSEQLSEREKLKVDSPTDIKTQPEVDLTDNKSVEVTMNAVQEPVEEIVPDSLKNKSISVVDCGETILDCQTSSEIGNKINIESLNACEDLDFNSSRTQKSENVKILHNVRLTPSKSIRKLVPVHNNIRKEINHHHLSEDDRIRNDLLPVEKINEEDVAPNAEKLGQFSGRRQIQDDHNLDEILNKEVQVANSERHSDEVGVTDNKSVEVTMNAVQEAVEEMVPDSLKNKNISVVDCGETILDCQTSSETGNKINIESLNACEDLDFNSSSTQKSENVKIQHNVRLTPSKSLPELVPVHNNITKEINRHHFSEDDRIRNDLLPVEKINEEDVASNVEKLGLISGRRQIHDDNNLDEILKKEVQVANSERRSDELNTGVLEVCRVKDECRQKLTIFDEDTVVLSPNKLGARSDVETARLLTSFTGTLPESNENESQKLEAGADGGVTREERTKEANCQRQLIFNKETHDVLEHLNTPSITANSSAINSSQRQNVVPKDDFTFMKDVSRLFKDLDISYLPSDSDSVESDSQKESPGTSRSKRASPNANDLYNRLMRSTDGDESACSEDILGEALERVEETEAHMAEENQFLKDLVIRIPWNIPLAHTIETRMSSRPSPSQKQKFVELKIPLKLGPYTKEEDKILRANFDEFCKVHDIPHDPKPFLNFKYGSKMLLGIKERINFVQFLGKNLECRMLHSIYRRFVCLCSEKKKGRFTEKEDAIIQKFMSNSRSKYDNRQFSMLSKILNRDRLAVEKRYKCILSKQKLRTDNYKIRDHIPEYLQHLMKILEVGEVGQLKEIKITRPVWLKLATELEQSELKVKRIWETIIYPRLFAENPIDTDNMMKQLILKLVALKKTDYRDVNWCKMADEFENITPAYLYQMFKRVTNICVPKCKRHKLSSTLKCLVRAYEEDGCIMRKQSKIELKNGEVSFITDS